MLNKNYERQEISENLYIKINENERNFDEIKYCKTINSENV